MPEAAAARCAHGGGAWSVTMNGDERAVLSDPAPEPCVCERGRP